MPGHRAGGEARPVLIVPVEMVHDRADKQRRVGDAAGHHHIGAGVERRLDRVGAEIGVGRHHARQQRFERLAGFHQRQFRHALDDLADIVADHDAAGNVAQAEIAGLAAHRARAARRVGGAHVADDADVALDAGRQDQRHAVMQARRVAQFRVAAARQIFARDRALGEAFEDEVVDLAALGQFERWLQPVVRSAGAAADADAVAFCHVVLLFQALPPRSWLMDRRCSSLLF